MRLPLILWESATPTGLLKRFLREGEADVLLCTHTGIKWYRALPDGTHALENLPSKERSRGKF